MTLEKIAQQVMKYLDSVGVAADYDIKDNTQLYGCHLLQLTIENKHTIKLTSSAEESTNKAFMQAIYNAYPQKSPA